MVYDINGTIKIIFTSKKKYQSNLNWNNNLEDAFSDSSNTK